MSIRRLIRAIAPSSAVPVHKPSSESSTADLQKAPPWVGTRRVRQPFARPPSPHQALCPCTNHRRSLRPPSYKMLPRRSALEESDIPSHGHHRPIKRCARAQTIVGVFDRRPTKSSPVGRHSKSPTSLRTATIAQSSAVPVLKPSSESSTADLQKTLPVGRHSKSPTISTIRQPAMLAIRVVMIRKPCHHRCPLDLNEHLHD